MRIKKHKWGKEEVDFLMKWWPHLGSELTAKELGVPVSKVRRKIAYLGIKKINKEDRLCIECKKEKQKKLSVRCKSCTLKKIRERKNKGTYKWMRNLSFDKKIGLAVKAALRRSKLGGDIDTEYMIELWFKQKGKCFYTGHYMSPPLFADQGDKCIASIERIDSQRGYFKGNVVWARNYCNMAKNDASIGIFISMCKSVAERFKDCELEPTTEELNRKIDELETYID